MYSNKGLTTINENTKIYFYCGLLFMLTSTMKIKRNIVENYYKAKVEAWDELEEKVIFE